MKTHMDLDAWKLSMSLVSHMYMLTRDFPKEEIYGLTSQIRRAAVSIPSNIAEGAARGSNKDFVHFLNISLGSFAEVETQIILSADLDFISDTQKDDTIEKLINIRRLIIGLKRALQS